MTLVGRDMDKVLHQWQLYKEFFDLYVEQRDAYWDWQCSNMRTSKGRDLKRKYISIGEQLSTKQKQINNFEATN